MHNNLEIAQTLVEAGTLSSANITAAAQVLAEALTAVDAVDARASALTDQAEQENMIAGASEFARQDAAAGDKKDLSIDQAILQDAVNKEEVDESIIKHAEAGISRQCQQAAKALASAGLIDKTNQKYAAELIETAWNAKSRISSKLGTL